MLHYFLLQILKVHLVMTIHQLQRAVHQLSPVVLNGLAERIINRLLQEHCVSLFGECTDSSCNGEYHPRRFYQPLPFYRPSEMLLIPACQCLKIAVLSFAVSENTVSHRSLQALHNLRRRLKIHICYPERQLLLAVSAFSCKIIFQAVGAFSVNYFVKFISHTAYSPFSACARSSMRSSPFSIPTDILRKLSVMPRRSRISAGTSPWVCSIGYVIRDSTPPRLSA